MEGRVAHVQERMVGSAHGNAWYNKHVRQTGNESAASALCRCIEYDNDTYSAANLMVRCGCASSLEGVEESGARPEKGKTI